jgi:hypothetical protein
MGDGAAEAWFGAEAWAWLTTPSSPPGWENWLQPDGVVAYNMQQRGGATGFAQHLQAVFTQAFFLGDGPGSPAQQIFRASPMTSVEPWHAHLLVWAGAFLPTWTWAQTYESPTHGFVLVLFQSSVRPPGLAVDTEVPVFGILVRGTPAPGAGLRTVAPLADEEDLKAINPATQWWHPAVQGPLTFGGVGWFEPALVLEPRQRVLDGKDVTSLYWRAKSH